MALFSSQRGQLNYLMLKTCHVLFGQSHEDVVLGRTADCCWDCNRCQFMPLINYSGSISSSIPHFQREGEGRWIERKRTDLSVLHLCFGVWKAAFPAFFAWRRGSQSELMTRLLCSSAIAGWMDRLGACIWFSHAAHVLPAGVPHKLPD